MHEAREISMEQPIACMAIRQLLSKASSLFREISFLGICLIENLTSSFNSTKIYGTLMEEKRLSFKYPFVQLGSLNGEKISSFSEGEKKGM